MKKGLCLLLASTMLITAIPSYAVAADENETLDVSLDVTYGQTAAREMLEYINDFRTSGEAWYWNSSDTEKIEVGVLPALEYSYTLELAAMQRAAEIALSFDHTRPDGSSCYTAWDDVGSQDVDPYGYTYGENIAGGYSSAYSTYMQWREDDDDYMGQGHRRNMLGKNYTYIGIGHAVVNGTHFWVQQFGTGDPGSETEACEEAAAVVITVANDRVESFTADKPEAITLAGGESASLPSVTGTIKVVEYWRTPKVTVVPDWSAEKGNIIFLNGDKVTGHSKGSTKLTATVFNTTVEVPVTVTSDGHSWSDWDVTTEPTCTKDGSKTRTCAVCGEKETEVIAKLGHEYKAVVTDPTCTEGGYTTYTCIRCDDTYVDDKTDALGHTPGAPVKEKVVEPTCTEKGSYDEVVYCTVCKEELSRKEVIVDALGHTWDDGKITLEPTCTEKGEKVYTCTVCGETKTEVLAALGHTPGEPVKENAVEPTCTEKGSYDEVIYCTVCKAELSREKINVDALGHTWDNGKVTLEPTCTEKGEKVYTCTVCGETKAEVLAALGHTPGEPVKENAVEPTCTEKGSYDEVVYCTVCEEELSREKIDVDALGHSWDDGKVTTEPTCTAEGVKTYTCTVCGETRTEVLAATGHTPGESVKENAVEPTCTEKGSYDEVIYCADCGIELSREKITVDALGHTWDEGKITTEPTCTEEGVKTYTCTVCAETRTEAVSALGHTYVGGECTVCHEKDPDYVEVLIPDEEYVEDKEATEEVLIQAVEDLLNSTDPEDKELADKINEAIDKGQDITTELEITVTEEPEDAEKFDNLLDGDIFYLDISIVVKADGDIVLGYITETEKALTFSVPLPEELKGKNVIVLRMHNGEVDEVKSWIEDDTVFFTTDRFSTYALGVAAKTVDVVEPGDETNPDTGITTDITLLAFVMMSSAAGVALLRKKRA